MKKSAKTAVIACAAVALALAAVAAVFAWVNYTRTWEHRIKNFDEVKEHFIVVADFIADTETAKNGDEFSIKYLPESDNPFSHTDVPPLVEYSFSQVKKAFNDAALPFDIVFYRDGQIEFAGENSNYAVVYYDRGQPWHNEQTKFRPIEMYWYHAVADGNWHSTLD